jgi:hypothetical protein
VLTVVICIVNSVAGFLGEARQRLAGEAVDGPVVHRTRTEALVKTDRRLVPVEHPPFEPAAIALGREARETRHERAADPLSTMRGKNEQVLQVESAPAEERRVVVEEQRKARRVVPHLGDQHLGGRSLSEKRVPNVGGRHDRFTRQPLVLRQAADEAENERRIVGGGEANANRRAHGPPASRVIR